MSLYSVDRWEQVLKSNDVLINVCVSLDSVLMSTHDIIRTKHMCTRVLFAFFYAHTYIYDASVDRSIKLIATRFAVVFFLPCSYAFHLGQIHWRIKHIRIPYGWASPAASASDASIGRKNVAKYVSCWSGCAARITPAAVLMPPSTCGRLDQSPRICMKKIRAYIICV